MYLYNSASRKKELFVPNHPDIVKMYTCGPTVFLSAPGKWLQRLTTNEPDDSMIECAIRAMELVIPEEKGSDLWGT